MASFNQVILLGNLTRDIELRHTPSNQTVANIGLAVNRTFQTKDGERREETTFVDCESWGRQAEVMAQYLSKGRPVFIQGRLKLDTWQDQQGQNRSKLKVVVIATNLTLLKIKQFAVDSCFKNVFHFLTGPRQVTQYT